MKNIKISKLKSYTILIVMILLTSVTQLYAEENSILPQTSKSKYPSTTISNEEVSIDVFLPDAKKGFYRSTTYDWSGIIGKVKYKNHDYFDPWKDTHNPLNPLDVFGIAESSNEMALGNQADTFIRLGVGIIQKMKNSNSHDYKILDHGKWKVSQGKDWVTFKHTVKSDFGYAYEYEKTIQLKGKGFHIKHTLKNIGEKEINFDQYQHHFFAIDNPTSFNLVRIKYPFKLSTTSDTKKMVDVNGNSVRLLEELKAGNSIFLELDGYKNTIDFNKFNIENETTGAGMMMAIDQPIVGAKLQLNNKTWCPEHKIQLSIPSNQEKTWTSKYFVYENSKLNNAVDLAFTKVTIEPEVFSIMKENWGDKFQHVTYPQQFVNNVVEVNPGESIQSAMDKVSESGGGVVLLKKGIHYLNSTLVPRSKVTLAGERRSETIVMQGPELTNSGINLEPMPQVTDFIMKDFILQGTRSEERVNGIRTSGKNGMRHNRFMIQNVTVRDWSAQGVHMKRTDNIVMDNCDFQYNGSGGSLFHNVYFLYNKNILQSDCNMSNPILGKGNKYTSCEFVLAQRCEIRNANDNGIQADHEEAGYIFFHKFNIYECKNAALWFPCEDYYDKWNYTEDPKYAPQNIIINKCEIVNNGYGALWRKVGGVYIIDSKFNNKELDLVLYKCGVTKENSKFLKGNIDYESIDDWPQDVSTLW